jgi:hypothetical protein
MYKRQEMLGLQVIVEMGMAGTSPRRRGDTEKNMNLWLGDRVWIPACATVNTKRGVAPLALSMVVLQFHQC